MRYLKTFSDNSITIFAFFITFSELIILAILLLCDDCLEIFSNYFSIIWIMGISIAFLISIALIINVYVLKSNLIQSLSDVQSFDYTQQIDSLLNDLYDYNGFERFVFFPPLQKMLFAIHQIILVAFSVIGFFHLWYCKFNVYSLSATSFLFIAFDIFFCTFLHMRLKNKI